MKFKLPIAMWIIPSIYIILFCFHSFHVRILGNTDFFGTIFQMNGVDAATIPIFESPITLYSRNTIPLIGATRLIARMHFIDSFSNRESNYNLVLSFNDLRFFLFCCHNQSTTVDTHEGWSLQSKHNSLLSKNDEFINSNDDHHTRSTESNPKKHKSHTNHTDKILSQHNRREMDKLLLTTKNNDFTQETSRLNDLNIENFERKDTPNCIPTVKACVMYDYNLLRWCRSKENTDSLHLCTARELSRQIHYNTIFVRSEGHLSSKKVWNEKIYISANYITHLKNPILSNTTKDDKESDLEFSNVEVAYSNSLYFNETDGLLGLGFSFLNASWNSYINETNGFWALDLQSNNNNSVLISGEEDITNHIKERLGLSISKIQWGDRSHQVNDLLLSEFRRDKMYEKEYSHYATVYSAQFCGIPLLKNYSSHFPLVINTHIEGISVPAPLYRMIMEWINLPPNPDITIDDLPVLSLQLSHSDSSIYIPIADLIDRSLNETLHIYQNDEFYEYTSFLLGSVYPAIEIGTRILKRYMVVVDANKRRLGFLEKIPSTSSNSKYCSHRRICLPTQLYYEGTNACIDPSCSLYGIQRWDSSLQKCVIRIEVFILIIPTLLLFICVDLCVVQCHKFISKPLSRHQRNVVIH